MVTSITKPNPAALNIIITHHLLPEQLHFPFWYILGGGSPTTNQRFCHIPYH